MIKFENNYYMKWIKLGSTCIIWMKEKFKENKPFSKDYKVISLFGKLIIGKYEI